MTKKMLGRLCLLAAGLMAILTACMHLSCIVLGPECFEAQLAPQSVVQSAIDGTWFAPVSTIAVSSIFVAFALFALSRAELFVSLPFTRPAVVLIGALCCVRGLLTVQLFIRHPELVSNLHLTAGLLWLLAGLMYLGGHLLIGRNHSAETTA